MILKLKSGELPGQSALPHKRVKDRWTKDLPDLAVVFLPHEGEHLPGPFIGGQDAHAFCTGDQLLLLHHCKVGKDVIVRDFKELRQPPRGGEPDPDRVLREGEGDRPFD